MQLRYQAVHQRVAQIARFQVETLKNVDLEMRFTKMVPWGGGGGGGGGLIYTRLSTVAADEKEEEQEI